MEWLCICVCWSEGADVLLKETENFQYNIFRINVSEVFVLSPQDRAVLHTLEQQRPFLTTHSDHSLQPARSSKGATAQEGLLASLQSCQKM